MDPPSPAPIPSRRITLTVNAQQSSDLAALKARVTEAGIAADDLVLLRFLRARKYDVEAAFTQFMETDTWRKEESVAELYDNFDIEEFNLVQKLYPQWTGRMDKLGYPVYLYKVSDLTKEAVAEYSKADDRLDTRMIALYEHMIQFALPFSTSTPHSSSEAISSTVTIVDISNVSLSRFWALRSHMQKASVLASARYAETLGRLYLVGAPSFFGIVFGWVSKWFDAQTVDKIFILAADEVFPTLSLYIEPENIPIAYGGTLDFTFSGSRPNLDQAAKDTLGLDFLPLGPMRWEGGNFKLKGSGRSEEEVKRCTPERGLVVERVEVVRIAGGSVEEKEKLGEELVKEMQTLEV